MEIVFTYSGVRSHVDEDGGGPWDYGPVYELNKCPACEGIALRTYDWNESMDPGDATYSVLYPSNEKKLRGLPKKIDQGYQAAQRVRNIDPNAYGVLLGRVLDLVCEDRGATSGTLDQRLKSLADNGEIPAKLTDVATGLRKLRNIGAHADLGELTVEELPVLDNLTRAILEYVYSAPLLAKEAEEQFAKLKKTSSKAKKKA